jgi:hypothetical protein
MEFSLNMVKNLCVVTVLFFFVQSHVIYLQPLLDLVLCKV